MGMLRRVWELLNRDLIGGDFTRRSTHPYFGEITYLGSRVPATNYWEAELRLAEGPAFSVILPDSPDGPGSAEVVFCQSILGDLDGLFDRCRAAFALEYAAWTDRPFPSKWQGTFVLDGISVPEAGDPDGEWHVCYFVEPIGHYFTAEFANGQLQRVVADG